MYGAFETVLCKTSLMTWSFRKWPNKTHKKSLQCCLKLYCQQNSQKYSEYSKFHSALVCISLVLRPTQSSSSQNSDYTGIEENSIDWALTNLF